MMAMVMARTRTRTWIETRAIAVQPGPSGEKRGDQKGVCFERRMDIGMGRGGLVNLEVFIRFV